MKCSIIDVDSPLDKYLRNEHIRLLERYNEFLFKISKVPPSPPTHTQPSGGGSILVTLDSIFKNMKFVYFYFLIFCGFLTIFFNSILAILFLSVTTPSTMNRKKKVSNKTNLFLSRGSESAIKWMFPYKS